MSSSAFGSRLRNIAGRRSSTAAPGLAATTTTSRCALAANRLLEPLFDLRRLQRRYDESVDAANIRRAA